MSNKIQNFSVLFVKRNAAKRGPTSSEAWNDTIEEISHDLTAINSQWNNRLVPILATLPNGTEGVLANAVDAWTDGLDGRTLFINSDAVDGNYFNTTAERPNTVLEQIADVYMQLSDLEDSLAQQITASIPTATQISITDTLEQYTSSNVEDALAELRTLVDLLQQTITEHIG